MAEDAEIVEAVREAIWQAGARVGYLFKYGADDALATAALSAARPLVERAARKEEWQPIETAPRGEWVLCYEDSGNPDLPGEFYAGCLIGDSESAYWSSACGQYVTLPPEPTYWMPLPSRPGIRALDEGGGK